MTLPRHALPLALAAALTIGAAQQTHADAAATKARAVTGPAVRVTEIAKGLENPWGIEFLPGGRILVTERQGRLRIVAKDGKLSQPVAGVPQVAAGGQGGLLDVALSPAFERDSTVFLAFAEPRGGGTSGTSVARGKLVLDGAGGRLEDVRVIFRQEPAYRSSHHFGSRIVLARDGTLFVTTGDRYALKDEAQNPKNHIGKVIRITTDGSAAADNPKLPGWDDKVWSIGHRNVQGAALNPATGELWTIEHGARGGDEINIPRKGRNYGWPTITYGRDYSGARIGTGTAKEGMEQPIYYWDPSIAPSGAEFYTGDLVPAWKGNLFVGALVRQHLARLVIDGDKVVGEEKLLVDLAERIRDVRQGPDGAIYVATDSPDGRILRVAP